MSPQQSALIAILSDGQWHNVMEFVHEGAGIDYRTRFCELRKLGYTFERRRVEMGDRVSNERRMVGRPADVQFETTGQGVLQCGKTRSVEQLDLFKRDRDRTYSR